MPSTTGIVASSNRVDWANTDVYVYGHSWYSSDIHNTGPSTRAINIVNSALGFKSLNNFAVSGSQSSDCAQLANGNTSSKWTPGQSGFAIVDCLINDTRRPVDALQTLSTANGLWALIRRLIASAVVEETAGTTTGTWTSDSNVALNHSGGTMKYTNFEGATMSFSLAAGTYWHVARSVGGSAIGGQFTYDLSGTPVGGTFELDDQHVNTINGLTQAALTYEVTCASSGTLKATYTKAGRPTNTYGQVDCILTAPATNPTNRRILLLKPVNLATQVAAQYSAARDLVDTIAAAYPQWVAVCDPLPGWDYSTMTGADGLHPNDAGMAHLANAIKASLLAL